MNKRRDLAIETAKLFKSSSIGTNTNIDIACAIGLQKKRYHTSLFMIKTFY